MTNPFDASSSTPERDAFFNGLTETYRELLDVDTLLIEQLPLGFAVKGVLAQNLGTLLTLRRYCEFVGIELNKVDLDDLIMIQIGGDNVIALAKELGYQADDYPWFALRYIREKILNARTEARKGRVK